MIMMIKRMVIYCIVYSVYDNYEDDNCDKDDQENGDIYDNYEDDK